jgi:hypothetical protein
MQTYLTYLIYVSFIWTQSMSKQRNKEALVHKADITYTTETILIASPKTYFSTAFINIYPHKTQKLCLYSNQMFIVWHFISLMFFSVLYLYTSIYLSSDLHVLYSVLYNVRLRMAHVGRNML